MEKRNLLHYGIIVVIEVVMKFWNGFIDQECINFAIQNWILGDQATEVAKHQEWTNKHDDENGANDSSKDNLIKLFVWRS